MTLRTPRGRWALAAIGLQGVWMLSCESWRESSPLLLLAIVLVLGTILAAAWRALLPGASATDAVSLAAALVIADLAFDLASPYPPRFAHLGWEAARAAALSVGWRLGARWERRGAAIVIAATCVALAALLPLAIAYLALDGSRDRSAPADAALVLGFALDDEGRAQPQLVGRMEHAVDLYRRGLVPRLLLSGGAVKNGHTEAGVMRDLAVQRGIPPDALVLDEAARSTIENFACSLPILGHLGARRVLLVTEPWHMTRAMLLARRHGLDARPSPATSAIWRDPRHAAYWLFRDAVAWLREAARDPFASPGQCAALECEGCRRF